MNNIKLSMTAQIPSGFGMPVSGHAFDVTTCARRVDVQGIAMSAAGIDEGTGLAKSYFPGTTAWRPPNC